MQGGFYLGSSELQVLVSFDPFPWIQHRGDAEIGPQGG